LKGPVGIRIMNESFRRFVRSSQQRDEIEAWEREGDQSVWQFLKLSLIILAVAVGAWLLYTQQQFFNAIVAYVGALGAATGIIFKLIGDLRGRGSASSSGS
jgi:small-conductance mechanosensitive channel